LRRGRDGSVAADIAGIFVINLDERSPIYEGFLAHTTNTLGVPPMAIVRSAGVYADDNTLSEPWVREIIPGLSQKVSARGALGVSLAHFLTWRRIAATPGCQGSANAYALVFEDDERVRDSFSWAVQGIEALAMRAQPEPDIVLLNALRPKGVPVGNVGPVSILAAGTHKEVGKRPNVWTSAYLLRCGSAARLEEAFKGMSYNGLPWNGMVPQFDIVLQDMLARPENNLREWVVAPSQAISLHNETVSVKRAIDKMGLRHANGSMQRGA